MTLSAHQLSITVLMTPDPTNFAGNVQDGTILKLLDQVDYEHAYACASRFVGCSVVTVTRSRLMNLNKLPSPVHVQNSSP